MGTFAISRDGANLEVALPESLPDPIDTVVVVDIKGPAVVVGPPSYSPATGALFINTMEVSMASPSSDVVIRYTLDGTAPNANSPRINGPIILSRSTDIQAQCFLDGRPVSEVAHAAFEKVTPRKPVQILIQRPGIFLKTYLGDFDALPDFDALKSDDHTTVTEISLATQPRDEHFAMRFNGFIEAPQTGIYTFYLDSDDGSRLFIGNTLLIDNDGLHSALEKTGTIALEAGLHPITVEYFEKTGQDDLILQWSGPSFEKQPVESVLFH